MDAINKHLNSKENHHQWYQVQYEVEGEILDFDEDASTDCYGDEVNAVIIFGKNTGRTQCGHFYENS